MVFFTKNMRWLLFLARVAFICNLLFLLCIVIMYSHDFITIEFFKNIVIVLGWVFSFIINLVVTPAELILLFLKRQSPTQNWLRFFNLVIFIFQIIILFFVQYDSFNT